MSFKVRHTTLLDALFIACICVASYFLLQTELGENYSPWIGRMGIVVMLWCIITNHRENNSWFSLITMFEASFYIFVLGQSFLCGVGIENSIYNQYRREPVLDVNTAFVFNILCLLFLHTGVLYYLNKPVRHSDKKTQIDYTGSMRTVGWILFPFTLVSAVAELYRLFVVYRASGYRAAFASLSGTTSWAKMFSLIGDFFPSVLFLLFIAYRDNKSIKKLIAGGIVLLSIANFAIGNRSEPICYLVALMWLGLQNTEKRRERRKKILIFSAVILGVMVLIPIIGQTRNSGDLNINGIIGGLAGEDSAFSLIFTTISNLGYSVFPTIKTMQLIPNTYPFHYGQSYLYAILGILPNVFGGTHISVQYAALAQWLMKALGMTYGPGYSMPAEAYYNFGWFGFLVMPFIGAGISFLLDERNAKSNALQTFIIIGCFIVLFSIPRRDTLTALRNLVYYVGLVALAVKLLIKRSSRIQD